MVCDFCMGSGVRWRYQAKTFALVSSGLEFGFESDSGWAACDECSSLIECDDWDSIIKRAMGYTVPVSGSMFVLQEDQKSMRYSLEFLYDVFKGLRVGGRVLA
jgi:hypothetical protein